jgi:hypothetical protein
MAMPREFKNKLFTFRRLRQVDCEFNTILSYIARPCLEGGRGGRQRKRGRRRRRRRRKRRRREERRRRRRRKRTRRRRGRRKEEEEKRRWGEGEEGKGEITASRKVLIKLI